MGSILDHYLPYNRYMSHRWQISVVDRRLIYLIFVQILLDEVFKMQQRLEYLSLVLGSIFLNFEYCISSFFLWEMILVSSQINLGFIHPLGTFSTFNSINIEPYQITATGYFGQNIFYIICVSEIAPWIIYSVWFLVDWYKFGR